MLVVMMVVCHDGEWSWRRSKPWRRCRRCVVWSAGTDSVPHRCAIPRQPSVKDIRRLFAYGVRFAAEASMSMLMAPVSPVYIASKTGARLRD